MAGQVITADTSITLYIADKDINDSVGLDTLESVISNLDGETLVVTLVPAVDDGEIHAPAVIRRVRVGISEEGMQMYGYVKGVEVYTLQIIIN